MKIVYCGYDFFAPCLDELLKEGHEIIKLYTFDTDNVYNFNAKVLELASSNNIPVSFSKPSKAEIFNLFAEQKCDLLITAGYIYYIPIPNDCNFRGVNIHPTYLPNGKGPWPLPLIILKEKYGGVTIHRITEEIDNGPILIQDKIVLHDNEDLETLSCRSQLCAVNLIKTLFSDFDFYWNNAREQEPGEYWAYPSEAEMSFDGNMKVKDIDRVIRAFGKFDSCAHFLGKNWLIHDANCWEEKHSFEPNTIVLETNKEVLLAAVDGFVCIRYFEEEV